MSLVKIFKFCVFSLATLVTGLPIPTTIASMRPVARRCPVYYYLDHGTDLCEFCCDICCNAKIKSTEEECNSECPEYAKKLQEDAQKLLDSAQKMENHQTGQGAGQSLTWSLPLVAQIAVPVVVCLVFFLLVSLIYYKRHAIVSKFGGRRASSDDNDDDDEVSTPFQPDEAGQPDTDSREVDISLEATGHDQHPQPSSSPFGGGPTPFPDPARYTAVFYPSTSAVASPVSESLDGREGPKVMVLPSSRRIADGTELRTVQLSRLTQETAL